MTPLAACPRHAGTSRDRTGRCRASVPLALYYVHAPACGRGAEHNAVSVRSRRIAGMLACMHHPAQSQSLCRPTWGRHEFERETDLRCELKKRARELERKLHSDRMFLVCSSLVISPT